MKTRSIFAATLASAALLGACSNEGNDNGEVVVEGQPTGMTITFTQPAGTTRATGDANATAAEADVKRIDVYIFSGSALKHYPLTISGTDFSFVNSGSNLDTWKTKQIQTTTGAKTIFVGVNLPAATATALASTPLGDFTGKAHTFAIDDLVPATNDRIVMFSTAAATPTLVPAPGTNNVSLSVKRLVAKVTVEEKIGGIDVNAPGGTLDLTSLKFGLLNNNTKLFLVPKADGSDPNYATVPAGDFTSTTDAANWVAINGSSTAVTARNKVYAPENTSSVKDYANVSYAVVQGTFIPTDLYKFDGTDYTPTTNSAITPHDFWMVNHGGYTYYTDALTDAQGVAMQIGAPTTAISEKFDGGKCYWSINLNKRGLLGSVAVSGKKFDVFRNDYYQCTVNKIMAPGRAVPPGGGTLDEDVNIDVTVNIHDWNLVSDEYELVP